MLNAKTLNIKLEFLTANVTMATMSNRLILFLRFQDIYKRASRRGYRSSQQEMISIVYSAALLSLAFTAPATPDGGISEDSVALIQTPKINLDEQPRMAAQVDNIDNLGAGNTVVGDDSNNVRRQNNLKSEKQRHWDQNQNQDNHQNQDQNNHQNQDQSNHRNQDENNHQNRKRDVVDAFEVETPFGFDNVQKRDAIDAFEVENVVEPRRNHDDADHDHDDDRNRHQSQNLNKDKNRHQNTRSRNSNERHTTRRPDPNHSWNSALPWYQQSWLTQYYKSWNSELPWYEQTWLTQYATRTAGGHRRRDNDQHDQQGQHDQNDDHDDNDRNNNNSNNNNQHRSYSWNSAVPWYDQTWLSQYHDDHDHRSWNSDLPWYQQSWLTQYAPDIPQTSDTLQMPLLASAEPPDSASVEVTATAAGAASAAETSPAMANAATVNSAHIVATLMAILSLL